MNKEASEIKLNKEQQKAVETIEGPVLVVAGPGSGKTELLSRRVAEILKRTDTPPHGILCLTFTESAAFNMRERLRRSIGTDAYRVGIHTFHSLGVHIIERFPEFFYGGATFAPADELTQKAVLEELFEELSHDNPLASTHPEQGYVYLSPAHRAIGFIKQTGILPREFVDVLKHNERVLKELEDDIHAVFSERMSKKLFPEIGKLIEKAEKISERAPLSHLPAYQETFVRTLARALTQAEEGDSTKPLSAWKKQYIKKDDSRSVHRDSHYLPKMKELAKIYAKYRDEMFGLGYYDFNDMLLDTIEAIETNEVLRAELSEQFLYVLVDEFQDTNDAQMRLLHLLLSHEAHEAHPNIFVVGDDDQSIYRFQGAQIGNMLGFTKSFEKPTIVTLQKNYRSTQNIVDIAYDVIAQGEERLENLVEEINKDLEAHTKGAGEISAHLYATEFHEYRAVALSVREALDKGVSPREIAVIGRRHRDLEAIVPFLYEEGVPLRYDRKQDVLTEPHIEALVCMARAVRALITEDERTADALLPELLSYPFWGIDRKTLWSIAVEARNKRTSWIETMSASSDEKLQNIAAFLLDLSARALHEPLEYILDAMVGAHVPVGLDSDDDDSGTERKSPKEHDGFVSPFRDHYFSREDFETNKARYITFLSSLRVFVMALREYKHGERIKLNDLLEFVDLHQKNNLILADVSPFISQEESVELLTAHKAKGLEYEHVHIISLTEDAWRGKTRRGLLPFPQNLSIAPGEETLDDELRLLYVALTRAKRTLFLSAHTRKENGNDALPLSLLGDSISWEQGKLPNEEPESLLETLVPRRSAPPFRGDETAILKELVEDYMLSPTHFNNFLDVTNGGPELFLEANLLRFPQPKSPSGVYGSLIHGVLERMYTVLRRTADLPTTEDAIGWFVNDLERERLSERDHEFFKKRGTDALKHFLSKKRDTFKQEHLSEVSFRSEGVCIEKARITGKIDKIVPGQGGDVAVYDFKTGKAHTKWNKSAVQLWRYRNQLIFYKLLVEGSSRFEGERVEKGVLEFIEPAQERLHELDLTFETEEVERVKRLIEKVYTYIVSLEFPDTTKYRPNVSGIREFEDDLLGE